MDMLKFHMFTIGHAWTTDFGCSEDKEQFEWLMKYVHGIRGELMVMMLKLFVET